MSQAAALNPRQEFRGRLVLVGFGCIGQGVLPLLLRHISMQPDQMLVISPSEAGMAVARQLGVPCLLTGLSRRREALMQWRTAGGSPQACTALLHWGFVSA